MLTSDTKFLEPELMDVVRLFDGAQDTEIVHTMRFTGNAFENTVALNGRVRAFSDEACVQDALQYKSLAKRYAKLALYAALSEETGIRLPWGALTGIRPTRLAYAELDAGRPFEPLFERMRVSADNIALVRDVIAGQKPFTSGGRAIAICSSLSRSVRRSANTVPSSPRRSRRPESIYRAIFPR